MYAVTLNINASSASELQKDVPNSVDGIKSHISHLKERYAKDLDALLDDQVERYYEDALDRYHSYDPACVPPIDDPEEWPREYHTFKVRPAIVSLTPTCD